MGNITIKKADGTTDVTFTMIAPSAGDDNPALYRSLTTGGAPARQDSLEVYGKWNGAKTVRRVNQKFVRNFNVTDPSGVESRQGVVVVEISVAAPTSVPQSHVDEAVAQSANLYKAADIQSACKTGYAPRT